MKAAMTDRRIEGHLVTVSAEAVDEAPIVNGGRRALVPPRSVRDHTVNEVTARKPVARVDAQ
jgi:hypothetical protein